MALSIHLEKLVHFVGTARTGSIRGYAIAHSLSQPAIFKAIQNLETDLETALLVRNMDGVQLTQAGQKLFEFAEEFL